MTKKLDNEAWQCISVQGRKRSLKQTGKLCNFNVFEIEKISVRIVFGLSSRKVLCCIKKV